MTGKFKCSNNVYLTVTFIVTFFAWILFCVLFVIASGNKDDYTLAFVIVYILLLLAEIGLLTKGSFTADDDKVTFRIGFIKHTYGYSEINLTGTRTGFTRGRYGFSLYAEIVIFLKNGNIVSFRDTDVPDNAMSSPEKHKQFQDKHQFTKLSDYINQRVKR